jgi:hypothetical protein
MSMKLILLAVACLLLQVSSLSLTHDSSIDLCFYEPLGHIDIAPRFKYTITKAWTAEEGAQIKSGALNSSDFINVDGWFPYRQPIKFFEKVGEKATQRFSYTYTPLQDVLHGSDAPEFGLDDASLEFAFGNPSEAKLYQVPSGKAIIALRFQASVSGSPYLGRWSVLIDLIDDDLIEGKLRVHSSRIRYFIESDDLGAREVTAALNIIPPFIENSIFWTFSTSPATGTSAPIQYDAFLVVLRGGEKFLAGPINDGQPGVTQIKDLVKDRSECTE